MIGTDGFQEADICGITMPITKHNFLVTDPAEIPQTIAAAFHLASTGRPGPVLVDIPKDVLQSETTFVWPQDLHLPGYRPTMRPHAGQIAAAAKLIAAARRPVLYVGGGVLKARATEVPSTAGRARPAFRSSPRSWPAAPSRIRTSSTWGCRGCTAPWRQWRACSARIVIVALGARFDDRVTGQLSTFAPGATVIHADIDPAEIGKNRVADVPIVGDAGEVITELIAAVAAEQAAGVVADLTAWWAELDDLRETFPLGYDWPADGSLSPQYVIERLGAIAGPDAIYAAGVGQHQMWAAQFIKLREARTPGSTPAVWAPWATRCRRRWARRWAGRRRPCGRSTATAASR